MAIRSKSRDLMSRKKEPLNMKRQKDRFFKVLLDFENVLNDALGGVDQATEPEEMLWALQAFISDKVKLEAKLVKQFNQFESQVKQSPSE